VRADDNGPAGMGSLTDQERACREYAEAEGFEGVALFSEVGPGVEVGRVLRLLVSRCERGEFGALVVAGPAYLSRDKGTYMRLHERLQAAGVSLHYAGLGEVEAVTVTKGGSDDPRG
jgi:hypothetical protein